MARQITHNDTPFSLAQELLGDGRLVHELVIPHWKPGTPLPVGEYAYIQSERPGPPAQWAASPRRETAR